MLPFVTAVSADDADSRVHVANVGMRWPEEVDQDGGLATGFVPPTDLADLPRLTAGIYRAEDQDAGLADPEAS